MVVLQPFARIVKSETHHCVTFDKARLSSAFDHFYETNCSGEPGYGTRYISLAHEVRLRDTVRYGFYRRDRLVFCASGERGGIDDAWCGHQ